MEISEMKDGQRYSVSVQANGSVWKKIATAAEKKGVSVNRFMLECARTGWKNALVDDVSGDTFEDLKNEYPLLEGYLSACADMVSMSGIMKFMNIPPQTALQIVNRLMSEGHLVKGRGVGVWKYVGEYDTMIRTFATSWVKVDDEIRRYAVQFIQEAGSYRPAEAMSTWSNLIKKDLSASGSYEIFLGEHHIYDDFGFESYIKSEITKISNALDVTGVSHKKRSGGVDINPNIFQEMIKRDIDFDGWEDLV